ncbi:hypothetical protein [uncultured Ruthenibacterium sp.]|uniref:hypothetical protein n=1 Tax=uncultured Ruthenibacterium sp. TaxID=1905347 RepID=UPI00349EC464
MKIAILLVIALVIIIFHYWACRRPPKYWYTGGIIPLAWLILLTVLFFNGMINWAEDWKIVCFPTLLVFLMWGEGYEWSKKKELAKMKAQDIE